MNIQAYWDYDTNSWYFDFFSKPIKLPMQKMKEIIPENAKNTVEIEILIGHDTRPEYSELSIYPVKFIRSI